MMKNERKPESVKQPLFKGKGNVFVRPDGTVRTGWLLLCAVILYRCVSYGLSLGLGIAFGKLFSVWRVNASNIHLAPRWARMIWSWHGSIITAAVCAATVLLSLALRGRLLKKRRIEMGIRPGLACAGVGAGIAVVSMALFILSDSVRPEWPIAEPKLSVGLVVMLPVTVFTAYAEELFTKCVVFDIASGRMKRIRACVTTAAVFFLFNGGYAGTVISCVNVMLMGVASCILYEKYGLWAPVLFRSAWSYVSVFAAGFGAMNVSQSMYALYSVSETWLTGGDGGLIYGLWMTFILVAMVVWMERKSLAEMKKRMFSRKA